jgi:sugar phosphate isomerase/epimerase
VRVGLFTDSLERLSLGELLGWLEQGLPEVRDLELGTGGYSPAPHLDLDSLLGSDGERRRWLGALETAGFRVAALNVSGNPLELARHDRDLLRTIELAGLLGVDRIVCMSGGRASLSAGGWFPELEQQVELYWQTTVLPYWQRLAETASAHEGLRLCFELEPGAAVYNVTTFERVAAEAPNLAVNLDPSHFFWQSIDPLAVVRHLGGRVGFVHGKDTVIAPERVSLDGALDRRSWRFATVGQGHDAAWWRTLVEALHNAGYDGVVSIEFEDPTLPPEQSVVEAAHLLGQAMLSQ